MVVNGAGSVNVGVPPSTWRATRSPTTAMDFCHPPTCSETVHDRADPPGACATPFRTMSVAGLKGMKSLS